MERVLIYFLIGLTLGNIFVQVFELWISCRQEKRFLEKMKEIERHRRNHIDKHRKV